MWACRLFLSRPRALLSQLHRPVLAKTAAASAARWHGSDCTNLQPPETIKKKHLYLVLDDTNNGISIHKLDLEKQLNGGDAPLGRLPNPPVMRMESPSLGDHPTAAIVGSSIVGFGSGSPDLGFNQRGGATVAFDTHTAALISLLSTSYGNKLYVIESNYSGLEYCPDGREKYCRGGLHCLKLDDDDDDGDDSNEEIRSWSWYKLCFDSPSRCLWCHDPMLLPLSPEGITGHAVHPGGRAFFVSVHSWDGDDDHRYRGTFSFHTKTRKWRRHGDWQLPFGGQAHYDASLGSWIGLHINYEDFGNYDMDGYLCSCVVPSPDKADDNPAPEWKLIGKQKLFLEEDPEWHVEAKLVPMGGQGRFCLVEMLTRDKVDIEEYQHLGDGDKCVLRLTTFRVKHGDGNRELVITDRRSAGSYKLS
ncbi:hypothetical protein EJB05_25686, partial [Eragrostis curvula]